MGSFSGGVWNLLIIVLTVGGILAVLALIIAMSRDDSASGSGPTESMGHVWDENLSELNNPMPRWWLNMFYITLVYGALYLVFYPGLGSNDMFFGWTQVKQYEQELAAADEKYGPLFEQFASTDIETLSTQADALKVGRRLYATYCTGCHGSDARGARGFPNLRDKDWLYGGTPEAIETTLLNGRQGIMPAWLGNLGDKDESDEVKEKNVAAVAQYVLSLAGREHDAGAASAGGEKYATYCLACHGANGEGNQMLGAPNLTDDVWLYGASAGSITHSIAKGRQGRMPAQAEWLGEDKVHVLAAYVYSLSR